MTNKPVGALITRGLSNNGNTMEVGSSTGERLVAQLALLYTEAGGNLTMTLATAGLSASALHFIHGDIGRIPAEDLHRLRGLLTLSLAELLARRSGREIVRVSDWRIFFFCLVNCRSLREAFERASEVIAVMDGRCGQMSLHVDQSNAEIRIESIWLSRDPYTFVVDAMATAMFIDIFSWLIGEKLPIIAVVMNYPRKMEERFDPKLLLGTVTMNAGRTGFTFPASCLDYPVIRTSKECETGMDQILSSLFDLKLDRADFSSSKRARRIMMRAIRDQERVPSLDEVSHEMGCSRSQLRRWLGHEGVSYNDIKESCRREVALDLLRRSSMPIEDIAARLGYCDADAFRQAFRQWIGTSPTAYRRAGGVPTA